ncbi:hypothetical protein [Kitasatospora sp. MBT63]|uniref:hypothetical protein n=1 Tax=Kitasatospora sp. MBT63 TaxID=1444768 RepID=UPI0007C757F1|nr:hypothetical protein [Kitasatospora sp. MBT63]
MNDLPISPLHALPDGNAELHVVLTLSWNDVASLGREAGRLAARLQRAVSLDEAASHVLSSRPETAAPARARANPALAQPAAPAVPAQVEQARQSAELMMRPTAPTDPATAGAPASPVAAAATVRPDAVAAASRPASAAPTAAPTGVPTAVPVAAPAA